MDYSKRDYETAIQMNDAVQKALILPNESFDSLGMFQNKNLVKILLKCFFIYLL